MPLSATRFSPDQRTPHHIGNINSFAVISDVHLPTPTHPRTYAFIATLESLKPLDALFLLGDIFEFIFIGTTYFEQQWQEVFAALRRLQEKGTRIFFLEGNHDFGFQHFLPSSLSTIFSFAGDAVLDANHAQLGKIRFAHGDNIVSTQAYRRFRKLVKSHTFQWFVHLFPGTAVDAFFSRYAVTSRAHDAERAISDELLKQILQLYAQSLPTDRPHLVFLGHLHKSTEIHCEKIRFLFSSDWISKPEMIIVSSEGIIERKSLVNHKMAINP